MIPAPASHLEKMIASLSHVNWQGRKELYAPLFSGISFKNNVEKPSASVIIISWRFVDGLATNIALLNKQRTGNLNYEIVFVNNGAGDGEFASVASGFDTYIKLTHNTGAYIARNIGSLFAKAPVLVFLEDDGIVSDDFMASHIHAFEKYDIISMRGVCRPLTDNPLNKLARHYYLGKRPYPAAANLEGNSSYRADAFFKAGGWSDEISFGHGGPELSYRLTKLYPDQRMQIYHPKATIFHDYAKDDKHLKNKKEKQNASYQMLAAKYHDWEDFMKGWLRLRRKGYLIKIKKNRSLSDLVNHGVEYLLYGLVRPVYRFILGKKGYGMVIMSLFLD